jgi:hypothetical protein
MVESLTGDLAPERAALALALVAGVQVMRQMIGLSALTKADPAAVSKLLAPLFQALIDGDGGTAPRRHMTAPISQGTNSEPP